MFIKCPPKHQALVAGCREAFGGLDGAGKETEG